MASNEEVSFAKVIIHGFVWLWQGVPSSNPEVTEQYIVCVGKEEINIGCCAG